MPRKDSRFARIQMVTKNPPKSRWTSGRGGWWAGKGSNPPRRTDAGRFYDMKKHLILEMLLRGGQGRVRTFEG